MRGSSSSILVSTFCLIISIFFFEVSCWYNQLDASDVEYLFNCKLFCTWIFFLAFSPSLVAVDRVVNFYIYLLQTALSGLKSDSSLGCASFSWTLHCEILKLGVVAISATWCFRFCTSFPKSIKTMSKLT